MACLHLVQRFSQTEWEVSNKKRYNCIVNLTENEFTRSCNLPQLQKMPCAHVIAACAKKRDCANISTYSLCALWYNVENYSKTYTGLFHHVIDLWYWPERNEPTILPPKIRRSLGRLPPIKIRDTRMKGMKAINTTAIATIRLGVPTLQHHHLLLRKYMYGNLCNMLNVNKLLEFRKMIVKLDYNWY